jgi:hypothetical protein
MKRFKEDFGAVVESRGGSAYVSYKPQKKRKEEGRGYILVCNRPKEQAVLLDIALNWSRYSFIILPNSEVLEMAFSSCKSLVFVCSLKLCCC